MMEGTSIAIAIAIIGFIITLILFAYDRDAKAREEELQNARSKYDDVLTSLKTNPSDPDMRQKAVEIGRVYSNLTRNKRGVTVYDEMALMNDINAACAGATAISSKAETSPALEERLAKLSELYEKDIINELEYKERRQKILDEI